MTEVWFKETRVFSGSTYKALLAASVLAVLAVFLLHNSAFSEATEHPLSVAIEVLPAVEIQFPEGTDFTILVAKNQDTGEMSIEPVEVPFTVRGGTTASVSISPESFCKIEESGSTSSRFLGKAVGKDKTTLGYDIILEFPVTPSSPEPIAEAQPADGAISSKTTANLSGVEGQGTTNLKYDLTESDQVAHGVVHLVSKCEWTEGGERAPAGEYSGNLAVTVMAGDE